MRATISTAAVAFAIASTMPSAMPAAEARRIDSQPPRPALHVLLIGNSYLYYNNAPRLLEAIAESTTGPTLQTELVAHGGWTLADHWDDAATRAALNRRRWDWIVLNEQSTFGDTYLVDGQSRVHSSAAFEKSVANFATAARERGARLAVVAHWPRLDAPERDREALRYAFAAAARAHGVVLIPAAAAWTEAARTAPHLALYDVDGSHPSPTGSYLLASLIYTTVTSRSPAGASRAIRGAYIEPGDGVVHPDRLAPLVDLPVGDSAVLQRVAYTVGRTAARSRSTSADAPASIQLPTLPSRGEPITAADLDGTWRGSTTIYPVAPAATLELTIHARNGALSGTLRRVLGPSPDATEITEVGVAVTGHVITVTDPKGPNGGSVVYKGVRQGGRLVGVVEFAIPVPMLYGIGSWSLAKAP